MQSYIESISEITAENHIIANQLSKLGVLHKFKHQTNDIQHILQVTIFQSSLNYLTLKDTYASSNDISIFVRL